MKGLGPAPRLGFALRGLLDAWQTEATFRLQVAAAIGVVGVLVWLRPSLLWVAVVVVLIGAVLAAELLNTALEHMLDAVHPEHNELVRVAKDCAAAAVLVLSTAAAVVFVLMLLEVR
ncbi:MAG TPA: diacylglycerol kinase [Burkholderiales bacterium]|nr:diacylglycerol kinase [Burkholderiales bacterium]